MERYPSSGRFDPPEPRHDHRPIASPWPDLTLSGRVPPVGWTAALTAAGLLLYWLPLTRVRLAAMNGYGLISALPLTTIAGAVLLAAAFVLTLALDNPYRWLLTVQVVATVISLHGIAPALEPYARDPTAWQHAGFVEYMARTGTTDVGLDARFSWPGFFALAAFVMKATGVHDIEPILHWAPVADQLLYLLPLVLILRALRINWRARWLAAWLFAVVDWVGQDYFSPQAFAYLFYLAVIGILLTWFRPTGRPGIWLARRRRPIEMRGESLGEREPEKASTPARIALLGLLIVMFLVVTASHQLTPYMILFAVGGLVLVRRCTAVTLPVLFGVIVVCWVSFMTVAYWRGHQSDLFSGLGNVLANLNSGVAGRISNSGPELAAIQRGRVFIAITVTSLAMFGAFRRRLWRIDDRVLLVLLFAPFLSMGLQNYGGEITLRVYFFILPAACALMACAFFPTPFAYRSWRALTAAGITGVLLVGGFLFVRFGNETSQRVQPQDVKALDTTIRLAPPGRLVDIGWLTDQYDDLGYFPQMPWGFRSMERFDYSAVRTPRRQGDVSGIVDMMRRRPDTFFVMTKVQDAYLHYNFGVPTTDLTAIRHGLDTDARFRSVYNTPEAAVYVLRDPPPDPPPPVDRRTHFTLGETTLTPVGLAAAALLLILLIGYEVRRIMGPRPIAWRLGALLRPFPLAIGALLAVLAVVVLERFAALG